MTTPADNDHDDALADEDFDRALGEDDADTAGLRDVDLDPDEALSPG